MPCYAVATTSARQQQAGVGNKKIIEFYFVELVSNSFYLLQSILLCTVLKYYLCTIDILSTLDLFFTYLLTRRGIINPMRNKSRKFLIFDDTSDVMDGRT